MAILTIPDAYRPGLLAILKLDDASVGRLVEMLGDDRAHLNRAELSAAAQTLPGLSPSEANSLVTTLLSLYLLRADLDSPVSDIVNDIADAMDRSHFQDLRLPDADRERLKKSLGRLLDIGPLERDLKGRGLARDFEHVFCTARILTDARPVFGTDVSVPPSRVLITHTLKISYHQGDELKDVFITTDARGLRELRNAIDRAELKARTLRTILPIAELPPREEE